MNFIDAALIANATIAIRLVTLPVIAEVEGDHALEVMTEVVVEIDTSEVVEEISQGPEATIGINVTVDHLKREDLVVITETVRIDVTIDAEMHLDQIAAIMRKRVQEGAKKVTKGVNHPEETEAEVILNSSKEGAIETWAVDKDPTRTAVIKESQIVVHKVSIFDF